MLRKIVVTAMVAGTVLTLCACNTVKGVGRDIESVGEAGDKAI
jgi:predicted small secreted protein